MKDSKLYRRVSTRGIHDDPAVRVHHPHMRALWMVFVQSCKRREISFNITIDDYAKFSQHACFFCWSRPSNPTKWKGPNLFYNGVDRVDNTLGYTVENLVTCCKLCNAMKSGLEPLVFLEHVRRIAAHFVTSTNDTRFTKRPPDRPQSAEGTS